MRAPKKSKPATVVATMVPVLVRAAGRLAWQCDHAEHAEHSESVLVIEVGLNLRAAAIEAFQLLDLEPIASYAARLAAVESRSPLSGTGLFEAEVAIPKVETWRDLQVAQLFHDRVYHPDVLGLARSEQLRHYTLHVSKLAWLALEACDGGDAIESFVPARIADSLLFGVKLSTVAGEILPESAVGPIPSLRVLLG
jgi:hypothetical protein